MCQRVGTQSYERGEALLADCVPLPDALLAANQKLEQGAIRVETILYELEARTGDIQIQYSLAENTHDGSND